MKAYGPGAATVASIPPAVGSGQLKVRAGIAAGMRVFAYTADSDRTELESLSATVFGHMDELPALLHKMDETTVT